MAHNRFQHFQLRSRPVMAATPASCSVMAATPKSPAVIDGTSVFPAVMNIAPEATKTVPRRLRLMSVRAAGIPVFSTLSSPTA